MRYGAFMNVAVATNEQRAMPWDGVYAMATPGRVFTCSPTRRMRCGAADLGAPAEA